ncbi:Peptidase cysteine/serine, trypsin-like protein [Metarhizium guizhouense ARSEF 977]|uniref:Peptidase cysteine/serine, trypsin-like protein n=1 Tax=Metarhizium guizhouense (strain ARSEF 977) TaxID=1276136 RepID=A0A0B4HRI0_METGA|nr:Peptidase cysteine/serine, trypsin-like protein [Metarhizium guizhouense ARSEF 977]
MVRKVAITLAIAFSAVLAAAATMNRRIVGGEDAKEGEFPFIVSLHFNDSSLGCGGSLLDSTTVLTAAHCLVYDVLNVRAGTLNKETGGVVAEVKSELFHPDYNPVKKQNDIAILKLSTPIRESKTISYANLPADGSDPFLSFTSFTAVAAGWGVTEDGNTVDKLRKVAIPIRAPDECLGRFQTQDPEFTNHLDTKVCAGEKGKDKDAGVGDSGGPLIDQETGQLIGITSFGGVIKGLGFYTRVGSYLPFINKNLGDSV